MRSPGLQIAMTAPSLEELDSFKYCDLQKLAKSLGLRANLKADKLLKALKAHLKQEARRENENQETADECLPLQDGSQTCASSCDESEIQVREQDHAERKTGSYITKSRRRRRTVQGIPDSQQDHSERKMSDLTEFQNQEQPENQDLKTAGEAPTPPDESQGDENADSMEESRINGNEDSKIPSERKKYLCTDAFLKAGKNNKTGSTTPNFKKLHEAHFKKMESIDQYIERKRKHFEEHSNSLNELKKQPFHKGAVTAPTVTPVPVRGRSSGARAPGHGRSQRGSQGTAGRSILGPRRSVKPFALSATKMNVRFSAATEDNEQKRSLTKTPARKSPHVLVSGSTPKGPAVLGTHKLKTTKADPATVITPLKLTAEAVQTPSSNKKPVFDLKASLSRPLTYEPHKGKLKPWGQSKENNPLNEYVSRVSFRKKTYKQPHLQTREEQRKKREQERKEKKAKVLGARRGLVRAAS
ncbi:nucleolar and spindle-associated protein 1 isoform X1 [Trichechus manatus latirostris]|uniref:Nucleolar and spindle-associated protein 1 isoform X1 n=1 Tax=Trichechus manatus latirostris TaxID=127582 RepID=A0A2Y9R8X0_TRIMA|nr:nucleolar and spindle-associated protein 1 isoform X1 [Trichechus manatus latirostris]